MEDRELELEIDLLELINALKKSIVRIAIVTVMSWM